MNMWATSRQRERKIHRERERGGGEWGGDTESDREDEWKERCSLCVITTKLLLLA